jgi:sulfonate transport system permease protein
MSLAHLRALPTFPRGALLPLAGPMAILGAWELAHRAHVANPLFLPPLREIAAVGRRLVANGDLLTGLRASLALSLTGLAIGALIGITAGVGLGLSRTAERALHPTASALKQISPFAFIPLLSFWLGPAQPAKIAFVALTCVFPIFVNTFEGVRGVPATLLEVGRTYRLSRWQLAVRIVLPSAAPAIFSGLHLGVFFSWLGTVGAEYFFLAGPGLGNIILDGRSGFRMDLVFFGIAAIGVTGAALNGLLSLAERRALRWRPRHG